MGTELFFRAVEISILTAFPISGAAGGHIIVSGWRILCFAMLHKIPYV